MIEQLFLEKSKSIFLDKILKAPIQSFTKVLKIILFGMENLAMVKILIANITFFLLKPTKMLLREKYVHFK